METKNANEFFEILGEIWRDITAIEFLMRCAVAQKEGDINRFPKPPYTKGRVYVEYPKSFQPTYFSDVAKEFNNKFPRIAIPQELIDFRNAMAHGFISEINHGGVDEVVKLRERGSTLVVEFSMSLELEKIRRIRQSLKELRRHIAQKAKDKSGN